MSKVTLRTPTDSYVTRYPKLIEFTRKQLNEFYWKENEIVVEKDKHKLLTSLTDAERHAIVEASKLFVEYELFIGEEYWSNRVSKMFPRPEVKRLCAAFAMTELCIHAPFYAQLNEALNLSNDEFWTAWKKDPVLSDRMNHLQELANTEDDRLSLAIFSLMEGAILTSNFSLFKSFNQNGNDELVNFGAGINQSAIDEDLHHEAGAYLFRTDIKESHLSSSEKQDLFSRIQEAAKVLGEHEFAVIEKYHEKGDLRGAKKTDFITFVKYRINHCLGNLGVDSIYVIEGENNPIKDWFGDSITKGYISNDFFNSLGREYSSHWNEDKFKW